MCGCRLYGEPVKEGWEVINRMGKGRGWERASLLDRELSTLTPTPALLDRPVSQGLLDPGGRNM